MSLETFKYTASEGNEKIATFMKWKFQAKGQGCKRGQCWPGWVDEKGIVHRYLDFHLFWGSLMPVVIEIGRYSPFNLTESGIRISDAGITSHLTDKLILNVWYACVLYIDWFNENQHRYIKNENG